MSEAGKIGAEKRWKGRRKTDEAKESRSTDRVRQNYTTPSNVPKPAGKTEVVGRAIDISAKNAQVSPATYKEHTLLWVVDADNPHLIEELMTRTAGRMNTLRIVPLITFQTVIERCKKIEEGSFFS